MLLLRGAFLGLICGAIGAALWAGVAYVGGLEHGMVSRIVELCLVVTIGGLAGFGMGMGNSGRGGAGAGVIAGFVAFLSVGGGMFAVSQINLERLTDEGRGEFNEETALDTIAGRVYGEFDAAGVDMGDDGDEWPSAVWAETCARWQSMSDSDRAQFIADLRTEYDAEMAAARPAHSALALLFSFGIFHLVWAGLAISTAFTIGATDLKAKQAERAAMTADMPPMTNADDYKPTSNGPNLGIFGSLGREDTRSAEQRKVA